MSVVSLLMTCSPGDVDALAFARAESMAAAHRNHGAHPDVSPICHPDQAVHKSNVPAPRRPLLIEVRFYASATVADGTGGFLHAFQRVCVIHMLLPLEFHTALAIHRETIMTTPSPQGSGAPTSDTPCP